MRSRSELARHNLRMKVLKTIVSRTNPFHALYWAELFVFLSKQALSTVTRPKAPRPPVYTHITTYLKNSARVLLPLS